MHAHMRTYQLAVGCSEAAPSALALALTLPLALTDHRSPIPLTLALPLPLGGVIWSPWWSMRRAFAWASACS